MTQSVLAHINDATLRVILVDVRARGDHVVARMIDTELFHRQREEDIRAHLDLEAERFAYDHSFDDGGMAEERARHP